MIMSVCRGASGTLLQYAFGNPNPLRDDDDEEIRPFQRFRPFLSSNNAFVSGVALCVVARQVRDHHVFERDPDAYSLQAVERGGCPSSTANAGASFVNLTQLRDGSGMATVFTANQLVGGPESGSTRPVVLKRSDKDQPAAHTRESRILQYLSRPGGVARAFVIQLLEAYSTLEYNFIAMEQGGQNLMMLVAESKALPLPERKTKLALWGQQACQVIS